jgi:DNA helicase II / ATP-dependent DNA helicase PcrA
MNASATYGSAIHHALSLYQGKLKRTGKKPDIDYLTSLFSIELKKKLVDQSKYEEFNQFGINSLQLFYENKTDGLKPSSLAEINFSPYEIKIGDVPIKGKIDRIDFIVDGQDDIVVIDYKTGKHDSKKLTTKTKGDYYTQLLFYNLLISQHPKYNWRVKNSEIIYVDLDGNGNVQKDVVFENNQDDLKWMIDEIRTVYNSIMSLDFDRINEKDCHNKELHNINFKF